MPIPAAKIKDCFFLCVYIPVHYKRSFDPAWLFGVFQNHVSRKFDSVLTVRLELRSSIVQQNGYMYEASLSISPAGCAQIVTMFITLNHMVYFDQILLTDTF